MRPALILHPHPAIAAFVEDIAQIEARGIDRDALAQVAARMAALACETGLFSFDNFPLPTDAQTETAVRCVHLGAQGQLPLQVLSGCVIPGLPRRAAHLPHQHPTWAAAACVRGATYDTLWRRSGAGDALTAGPEVRVGPGQAFTMMARDIHSVRGDTAGPSLHLLMYGHSFERAVVFDPDGWRAYEHQVPALTASGSVTAA